MGLTIKYQDVLPNRIAAYATLNYPLLDCSMIDSKKFEFIKRKYGDYASWAIWSEEGEKPKSNIGDLTILDPQKNKNLFFQLNPNVVLVGLNISRGSIEVPFANFHDKRPEATDYKIRYALRGSPFWGGYMTDIIKDFDQKTSGKVVSYLRANKAFEEENVNNFRKELEDLGSESPTIIAFGKDAYVILVRNLKYEYKIFKVPHYANYTSKENYREQIKSIW